MLSINLVNVETPTCIRCGQRSIIAVPDDVIRKMEEGMTIHDSWPYASPDEWEMLKTGIHPECWEDMFGGSDCD